MNAALDITDDILEQAAREQLWLRGNLSWKLWPQQRPIYETVKALPLIILVIVFLCARQFGKSVLGVILACEDCLTNPDVVVMIIAPTIKQARDIVRPRMKLITRDAPAGLIRYNKSEDTWYFANGAELKLGGFDTNSMAQRGKTIHKIYFEETADSDGDDYLDFLRSDLGPALTHSAHAQIIHLTTLPKVPDHPFALETVPEAELGGALFTYTIRHNLMLTPEKYAQCVKLCGGEHTTAFKREYLCQQVRDDSIILAPEFDEALHVRDIKIPEYCYFWVGGDIGGIRDMSVFHLCGYDFKRAKILFLDERAFGPETGTGIMVDACRAMEGGRAVSRHVDAPGQLQIDLMGQHKFPCSLPRKDELEATVNQCRVALQLCQVEIDPRCKLLITTLRSGTFNHNRTDLARTSTLGHMDAFMSFAYGLRHANTANPYPHSATRGRTRTTSAATSKLTKPRALSAGYSRCQADADGH
jgi:hypothetical protein